MSTAPGPPDDQPMTTGYTGMPGWVKWLLVIAAVLALVLVAARLSGVEHGPGRHASSATGPAADVLAR